MVRFVVKKTIPAFVVIALSACVTAGPAVGPRYNELAPTLPLPAASTARVIVFSAETHTSNYRYVPVSIDDETIGWCKGGGFNQFAVSPGRHVIDVMRGPKQTLTGAPTIQGASCPRDVELAGGATYFFEIRRSAQYDLLSGGIPFLMPTLLAPVGIAVDVIGSIQGACVGPYSIEAIDAVEGLRKIGELHLTLPYVPTPREPAPPKLER